MIWVVNIFPYKENIRFHKNIEDEFYDVIIKPWARDLETNIRKH